MRQPNPPRKNRRRCHQSGLTLVELMLSMVILSIALAAALSLGFTMADGYRIHRRMAKVETASRISLQFLTRAIRGASPGAPSGGIQDLVGCSANTNAIDVINHTVTTRDNANADPDTDELRVIYGSGGVFSSLRDPYDQTAYAARVIVVQNKDDVAFPDVHDNFQAGDLIVVSNFDVGHLLEIDRVIDNGNNTDSLILKTQNPPCTTTPPFPAGDFPAGSMVVRAQVARFYVDPGNFGGVPTLVMDPDGIAGPKDPEPLAEGVEDMQIAVGVDVDGDGIVNEAGTNTDEWFYNVAADVGTSPPAFGTAKPRAYRITLVTRSVIEASSQPISQRPAIEDRAAATAQDEFRRRVLSTTVEIRNMQGSP